MSTTRRLALAVLGLIVALLATPSPVHAHASLVGVAPADGAVVEEPPAVVEITFDESVSLTGGDARALDDTGAEVSTGASASGSVVSVALPPSLPEGTYVVTWRVISGDSHPVSGSSVFHVGEPSVSVDEALAVAGDAPSAGPGVRGLAAVTTAVGYLGVLVAVGVVWFRLLPARDVGFRTDRQLAVLRRRAVLVGAAGLVVSVPFRIARIGGGLDSLGDEAFLRANLTGALGWSIGVTIVGLALLTGVVGRPGNGRDAMVAVAGASIVTLSGFVIEGHTRTVDPVGAMVGGALVHTAAAALWAGGAIGLALVLRRADDDTPTIAAVVRRFSDLAVVSVGVVALTGGLLAWLVLPEPSDLVDTGYGVALLTKIALVGVLVGIGAYNRFRLVPPVPAPAPVGADVGGDPTALGRIRRTVGVEAVLIVAVVVATAVLVARSPVPATAEATGTGAPDAQVVEIDLSDGGRAVTTVDPVRVGANDLFVVVRSPDGQLLDPIEPIRVELRQPALAVGPITPTAHELSTGTFHVPVELPLAGTWQLDVSVRVSEFDESTGTGSIEIAPD
ncbi:MAG: CopD family protein [Ilumatobacteraceae bacterium]|nr:CopD family protein [Ilumatobacteraceae bacterium]